MSATEDTKDVTTTATETTDATDSTEATTGKFVVASTVKAFIRGKGLQVSGDLVGALSDKVQAILETAVLRMDSNGRKTVRPHDL